MADRVGRRYELRDEFGAGGMGTVCQAFDVVLGREVAVKRISPTAIGDGGAVDMLARRFQREKRVTARIQHHGVPQVYDTKLDDRGGGELYLVMELVHGVPMVCRDFKPANVLVTGDGAVKALGFGIAAVLRPGVGRVTATAAPIRTSRYMPPEQVKGRRVRQHRDLYALGRVLYELGPGYPVFVGESDIDLWNRHLKSTPVRLREVREDALVELDQLVLELLEKVPADANGVYDRVLQFLPVAGHRVRRRVAGAAPVERRRRSRQSLTGQADCAHV